MVPSENADHASRNALLAIGKRLRTVVPGMRRYLALQISLSICSGLLIVGQCYLLTQIIARVFLERQAPVQVFPLLGLLLLVIVGRAILPWSAEALASRIAVRAKALMRRLLLEHLFQIGPVHEADERSGELAHVLSTGVEALDAYFTQVLPQICATLVVPLIVLTTVSLTDLVSGLILLATIPVLPAFMILIGKQSEHATQRRWHELGQMSAHFLEAVQGSTTLHLFGQRAAQRLVVRRQAERFGRLSMQVLRIAFLSALAMEMGATLSMALIAVEVGVRLLSGQIPFSLAFLVLILTPEFYQPLRALGPQFHASMESATSARRIFALLDQPHSTSHEQHAPARVVPPQPFRALHFEQVQYTYLGVEGEQRPALVDVSCRLQMGQMVAIIGPSGAGKSTLAHLLLRFAEPQQGRICLDGVPLVTFAPKLWRELVAWQPQRPFLFNMSVAENIALGRSTASREEIITAAQQAGIHETIQAFPRGYETIVGERGARLSGGQIQRLSLARALVKQAPILVLDEATSALDAASESQLLETLLSLRPSHLVLMMTHRLQTIRQADLVLVLHEGHLVEQGTHEELQQCSSLYRSLLHASHDNVEVAI
jgi:ATP-binding cassette subfamily C protein CydD